MNVGGDLSVDMMRFALLKNQKIEWSLRRKDEPAWYIAKNLKLDSGLLRTAQYVDQSWPLPRGVKAPTVVLQKDPRVVGNLLWPAYRVLEACLRIEGYAGGEGTINAEVQYLEALRFFFADSPFFESLKAGSDEWRLIKDANVRNRHFAQAVDYLARTEAQEAERLARGTEDWVKETIRLVLHQESDAEVVQRGVIAHRILSAWHEVRQGVLADEHTQTIRDWRIQTLEQTVAHPNRQILLDAHPGPSAVLPLTIDGHGGDATRPFVPEPRSPEDSAARRIWNRMKKGKSRKRDGDPTE
ncbi:hypothetical protein JCM16303_000770 [Sporobolomyces ruberrimus]